MNTDLTSLIADALHNEGDGGIWESFDRANSEKVATVLAAAIKASEWLAAHDREVAAGAIEAAADSMAGGRHACLRPTVCVECGRQRERDGRDRWLRDRAQAIRDGRA